MTQPVTPDLTNAGMDVTELAVGAKDVIASTAERFTSVIEGLLQHLSLENVLMQIAAVFVSMAIGYVISRRINTLVDRVLPGEDVRGLGAYARRALVAFTHNVSFSFISGSLLALIVYCIVKIFEFAPQSMVIARVCYNILYAFALLSLLMAFLQGGIGLRMITPGVRRIVTIIFWVMAVLQFFGILTDIIQYLDTTVIPIGGGSMTVWKLLVAIVSVLLTLGVANWLASLVNQMVEGLENMSENIKVVLKRVVTVIFMVLAVIIALGTVGIDLTILSVFGGAVGVGLGFGLQKIASNYISGFIILLDKSIKIGDLVTVGGFKGRVTEINTRFTVVRNNDGVENIVPNESFVTSAVLNHSYTESTSVQYIDISVAYDADVERALAIMLEEGMRARQRIDTGRRGWAYLDTFGDSGINLRLGFWVKDPVNGVAGLKTAISLAILKRFAEEGIEVPYNQLEVNLRKVDVGEIPVRMKVQSS